MEPPNGLPVGQSALGIDAVALERLRPSGARL